MEITLSQGCVALIDDEDYPLIAGYHWYARRSGSGKIYAVAKCHDSEGVKRNTVRMHRLILGAPKGEFVDHRSGETLDNRRNNLRLCTNAQNQQNSSGRGGASQFKGVSWYSRYGKWKVAFNHSGVTHFVGYFEDEVAAAKAYNEAASRLAGEFAKLNHIPDLEFSDFRDQKKNRQQYSHSRPVSRDSERK